MGMSGQETVFVAVGVMVVLGFLYNRWLWFKDGVSKMFSPQTVTAQTKQTPFEVVFRSCALLVIGLVLLVIACVLLVLPTCMQEPDRCMDVSSVLLLFFGNLGELIVTVVGFLWELAVTLFGMLRAMLA
jgi:hypothetical protein